MKMSVFRLGFHGKSVSCGVWGLGAVGPWGAGCGKSRLWDRKQTEIIRGTLYLVRVPGTVPGTVPVNL
eukprot:CAMPEP_0170285104 /NCGR_PEP_ID=MMETSP0116_2-20130129/42597_1 /TAXON_ID=400756 /ORGANISM="Durinskia baltica, Strain CSIRO CS-38" /LENGTH=67 /DNA_ID=CAMNT_0010536497 /DNA_START=104 /DNA_END=307 /DNA_ORIENTATION=-